MKAAITAQGLFDQLKDRLELRWLAGHSGASRQLESVDATSRRPSLAGYLNIIYPNKVQILGGEELAWLDSLEPRQRWETLEKILQFGPLALVVNQGQPCPEDLVEMAGESGIALWSSPRRGHERCMARPRAATAAPGVCGARHFRSCAGFAAPCQPAAAGWDARYPGGHRTAGRCHCP